MSTPSAHSSASFETLGHIQDSINTSFNEIKEATPHTNDTFDRFRASMSLTSSHNRSNSVNSKRPVPYLNLRDILMKNNRLSVGTTKNFQGSNPHGFEGNSSFENRSQKLNQTAPLHKYFMGQHKASNVGELQEQIVCLESKNAKYLEKMARMENELALVHSHREIPDDQGLRSNESSNEEKVLLPRRIKELEVQNIKLVEHNEYLSEKLNQLDLEYNHMKSYLDMNLEQYEKLYSIVQDNEESKENLSRHTKKLNGSLKSLNQNYILLQKKVALLEKENKEITENLRVSEAEKRNISEKWQKLSKRVRIEGEFMKTTKDLEQEVTKYQKEVCEYKEKYLSKDAQLRALREEEKNYKALIDNNLETVQNVKKQLELQTRKNEILAKQNLELMEKLTQAQDESHSLQYKAKETVDTQEDLVEIRNTVSSLEAQVEEVEFKKQEVISKLALSQKEIEMLTEQNKKLEEACQVLQEERDYVTKKWELLVQDHDKLQRSHKKLVDEYQDENILTETLQKIGSAEGNMSSSTSKTECGYNVAKDPYVQAIMEELSKVKPLSREVYENLERCLNMHVQFLNETMVSKEVEEKYNRLLVKYYRTLEKGQVLEKQLKESLTKNYQANVVNQNTDFFANIMPTSQKSDLRVPRLNLHDRFPKAEPKSLNNSMSFAKPSQNLTLQDPNQYLKVGKPQFQPLQRMLLNNYTPSEIQKNKQSCDASKENLTPNNGSRRSGSTLKGNVPVKVDAETQDLKNQLMRSKVLRSSSNDVSTKDERRSQGYSTTLSSNDTSNGPSLGNSFNLNIADILKDGERLRRANPTEGRTNSTKNRTYLDMHLSRKGTHQGASNVNKSFSFASNF